MSATTKTRYNMTFKYQASKVNRTIGFYATSDAKAQAVTAACRAKLVKGAGCMLTKIVEEALGRDDKLAKQIPEDEVEDGDVNAYITLTCSGDESNRAGKWVIPFQQDDVSRDTIAAAIVAASNAADIAYIDRTTNKAYVVDGYLKGGVGRKHDRFKTDEPTDGQKTGDDFAKPEEVVIPV